LGWPAGTLFDEKKEQIGESKKLINVYIYGCQSIKQNKINRKR
jgi:hypothetical protein